MSKKFLITGASGFIGSFLVEEALCRGHEIYAAIRSSSSKEFLQDPRIKFLELDLSCHQSLKEKFSSLIAEGIVFDYVIHNAGITHAKRKGDFHTTNFLYTKNFGDALISSGMKVQKFILVSSLASFGPGDDMIPVPIRICDKKQPITLYGKSKALAEEYIASLPLPYVIINPTAVYGPRDKGFLQFFKIIKKGFEPYIGRRNQLVSMIYVTDLAKAIVSLATSSEVNRSFIVSDGRNYFKEQLGQIAKTVLNRKTISIRLPLQVVRPVVGAVDVLHKSFTGTIPFINNEKLYEISRPNWLCDSTQVWDMLKDKPCYDLYNGLPKTIQWYKENKWL